MKICQTSGHTRQGGVLIKLLLGLGMLFMLGMILWVMFLPSFAASRIQEKTGFKVKVDSLSLNPFTAKVAVNGLVVKNPAGWPAEDFVDLREFRAEVDPLSLLSHRLVAEEVVVDLPQLTLVKNQKGQLNATVFQGGFADGTTTSQPGQGGGKHDFLIRHLVLRVGKLVYADYSGRRPVIKDYKLDLDRDMRDVDSVAKIISPLTGSAFGLVSGAFGGIFKSQPDLLKDVTGALQDAGRKTGEKLKGLLDSLDKK